LLCGGLAFAQDKPSIAVFDVSGKGTTPLDVQLANTAVAQGVRKLDAFTVVSSDDLRQLLSIERQKQLLGATDEGTQASLKALGATHTIVGSISKTGSNYAGELRLLDTQDGKVLNQKSVDAVPSLDKLVTAMGGLAQEVVGPLLAENQGKLLVRTVEEGAEITVDEVSRGSTPMSAPLALPMGRHRVQVKKDGFIARLLNVTIEKDQLAVQDVTLLPSADYAQVYQQRNGRMRLGAWIATGVAIAGIGSAILVDRVVAEGIYTNQFAPRQRVLEAVSRSSGGFDPSGLTNAVEVQCAANLDQCRKDGQAASASMTTMQATSWALVGVGAVAAGFATYFWVSGENPGRYTQLVAGVSPGGASIGLAGQF
jgi:hypothetical protein